MKRYLIFAGDQYYPRGGWNDYRGSVDASTLEYAKNQMRSMQKDWAHIVDSETGTVVWRNDSE